MDAAVACVVEVRNEPMHPEDGRAVRLAARRYWRADGTCVPPAFGWALVVWMADAAVACVVEARNEPMHPEDGRAVRLAARRYWRAAGTCMPPAFGWALVVWMDAAVACLAEVRNEPMHPEDGRAARWRRVGVGEPLAPVCHQPSVGRWWWGWRTRWWLAW
jgi:hypothetical protein